ncbi:Integrase zinc binding domain [Popillia japonica]|uniref:RNA-directed DNA polymerase n=1 Tax=Popillia japonica TaxID=7064 RepID=A0AAW1MGY9_POPJA
MISRNYIQEPVKDDEEMKEIIHSIEKYLRISPNRKEEYKRETMQDPVLRRGLEMYAYGWDKEKCNSTELKKYYALQDQLNVSNGLIFFIDCVIVPEKLRLKVLGLLHESPQGVNRTIKRARQLVYWPGISREIADMMAKGKTCEKYKPRTTKELTQNDQLTIPKVSL